MGMTSTAKMQMKVGARMPDNNSDLVVSLMGMTSTAKMQMKVGARMPENNSDLVFAICAMISLQQILEKTVPVRKNIHRGSCFKMSFWDMRTQIMKRVMAAKVDTRGRMAS